MDWTSGFSAFKKTKGLSFPAHAFLVPATVSSNLTFFGGLLVALDTSKQ
jgi:hypothetical protein